MKLPILLLLFMLACTSVARGLPQEKPVTGTVTDAATGEPLPGVNVLIEGTTTGVSTDLEGKYILPEPSEGAVISFSFIGYTTERITFSGQPVINIKLAQIVKELDQVVVIGYGTVKKSDLTGSVASVSSKEIEKATPVNIENALQGRVAGLMYTSNDGSPGSEGTVRIRGIGTVNSNDPIYVVDGMLIDNSDKLWNANLMGFLNPLDISSIEVLKDASAQAIYGSRGANGVILITTRKGSQGSPKITFTARTGFESYARLAKVLNPEEYRDYVLSLNYNDYMRSVPDANPSVLPDTLNSWTKEIVAQYDKKINTNWFKEILNKNRISQIYDLSLNGGTRDFHYSVSAGYSDQKGLLLYSDYKRYTFRLNTDYKMNDRISFGENLGISRSVKNGDFLWTQPVQDAMFDAPLYPVLKPVGSVDPNDPDYIYNKYAAEYSGTVNPVMRVVLTNLNTKTSYLNLVGNVYAEAVILKNLRFRTSMGLDLSGKDFVHFSPRYYISSSSNNLINSLTENEIKSGGWVWENTLTWDKKLKDHSITTLIGYTTESTHITYLNVSKQDAPGNDPGMQTFDAATINAVITGGYDNYSMISYLGRINYAFRNKYLITASLRYDGSSKFGDGHRWGTFPSFSAGWKINDEKWFKNLDLISISSLKLRAGWGQIGNSSLPVYYGFLSQYSSLQNLIGTDNRYVFNENVYTGYSLSNIGRPSISWETTEQTNFGIDMSFFKNSLTFTADYFIKHTRRMILQIPLQDYAGYTPAILPYSNVGSVQNKGLEVVMDYQGRTGKFSYGSSVNLAYFNNKVTSLGPENSPIVVTSNNGYGENRTQVGSSIGRFFGFRTNGIFQTEQDVQNYTMTDNSGEKHVLQPQAHPGDFRFMNINNDTIIDGNDKTWIGNPLPKLTFGFSLNIAYRAFDLVAFFQGTYGNDIYDVGRQQAHALGICYSEYQYRRAWRGEGTSNYAPIITTVDPNQNYSRNSDFYVEDGSYLRLKNLQVGLTLSQEACEKLKITKARIWVSGTNLLTFTRYHGNDPEIGAAGTPTSYAGFDLAGYYPKSREISLGVTISL
jgi:TonB-linked SusC/RagA family outer membrane protein